MDGYTALLYNAQDVARFHQDRPASVAAYLPLTPSAVAALLGTSIPILDPLQLHDDQGHWRDVEVRLRLEAFLERQRAAHAELCQAAWQVLIDQTLDAAAVSSRLWTTLQARERYVLLGPAGWVTTMTRQEATGPCCRASSARSSLRIGWLATDRLPAGYAGNCSTSVTVSRASWPTADPCS